MSFFFDNLLTTITIPSSYSTTGAYAVNGDTRYNIGAIRAYNNPDPIGTGTFNYFMCMSKNAPTGTDTNNYIGVFKITQNGTVYARDTYVSSWADYAEYFETFDQLPLDAGVSIVVVDPDLYELVVVDNEGNPANEELRNNITAIHQQYSGALDYMFQKGGYVRQAAQEDDPTKIIGVVRPNIGVRASSVVGNAAWTEWSNKYIIDDFGIPVKERYCHVQWSAGGVVYDYPENCIPSHVMAPQNLTKVWYKKDGTPYERAKLNPYYDPTASYKGRQDRSEWVLVGMLGQVPMLSDQPMHPNWIKLSKLSNRANNVLIK
jgi:hypothetical protein